MLSKQARRVFLGLCEARLGQGELETYLVLSVQINLTEECGCKLLTFLALLASVKHASIPGHHGKEGRYARIIEQAQNSGKARCQEEDCTRTIIHLV